MTRKPDTMQQATTARTIGVASSKLLLRNYPLSRALEIFPVYGLEGTEDEESLCRATLLLMRNWTHFGGETPLPLVLHVKNKFQEYAIFHAIDDIEEEIEDDEHNIENI